MKKFPSQHLNYYTLKKLSEILNPAWKNREVVALFSQSKDELVLEVATPLFPFLRISNLPAFSFVVPLEEFHKKRANVANIFEEIHGKKILRADVVQGERIFILELEENYNLVLKFFGTHSNVLLLQNKKVTNLFRKKLTADYNFSLSDYSETSERPKEIPLEKVREYFPATDKLLLQKISETFSDPVSTTKLLRFLEKIGEPPYYLAEDGKFFLIKPPFHEKLSTCEHLVPALQEFVKTYWRKKAFSELYTSAEKTLKNKIKATRNKIKSLKLHLQKLKSLPNYKHYGDILLANAYEVKNNKEKEVLLYDFYADKKIYIPIDPKKTVSENAEKYYKKHKKVLGQIDNTENLLPHYETLQQTYDEKLKALQKIKQYKTLKKWIKENSKLLRASSKPQEGNKSYKEFFFREYHILLGKSGLSNDELLRLAKKDDLWFHVKEGTGSHVIVKKHSKEKIPEEIKEFAASLAAYHSKAKHNKLVLVRYTPRKYLRKAKRLAKGQVLVDREETILVSPRFWEEVLRETS